MGDLYSFKTALVLGGFALLAIVPVLLQFFGGDIGAKDIATAKNKLG